MRSSVEREKIRAAARDYEQGLPPGQRKLLGQYFSGIRLGKLLAHLALTDETRTIVDPMAGHGDLLDAAWESAGERNLRLERLDGIEVHDATARACIERLAKITSGKPTPGIVTGDAFEHAQTASRPSYDLVITNPPYVRYQARKGIASVDEKIRSGLLAFAQTHQVAGEQTLWESLIRGYSGLADLSVPAWLLAAMMVRPGGRLALIVPATWRSRDYADVIRYLLIRCFALEFIVEDTQPGWFSDVLVRTHLIVARRLQPAEILCPVGDRVAHSPAATWLQVAPEAADEHSLVGAAFGGKCPEKQFADWARKGRVNARRGIRIRHFTMEAEWAFLTRRLASRSWFQQLEPKAQAPARVVNGNVNARHPPEIPDALREIFPNALPRADLVTLEEAGIEIGQGLRTGCNIFFYVTACGPARRGLTPVRASSHFDEKQFWVPTDVLRPVLRRQSEIKTFESGGDCGGRVLDLRDWILPEHAPIVAASAKAYEALGATPPAVMPEELANFVRAASESHPPGKDDSVSIPQLSAVCTNVRVPRNDRMTPRFWYMLPDFAPRHLPACFVARINNELPWVECNRDPPWLIDANFSTFWSTKGDWSHYALQALLNSAWCRTFMEATGTPMGGGALKLEATHLRRLPIPSLGAVAKAALDEAGRQLTRTAVRVQARIDRIVLETMAADARAPVVQLIQAVTDRAYSLATARRRAA